MTDERPFFFEYEKGISLGSFFEGDLSRLRSGAPRTGLWVLLCICLAISLAAMIGPLLLFRREGLRTEGAPRLMLFFASLGTGFMLMEIGLMQRLALYLGDPMYSLIVVLAGLLFFAGLGACFGGRGRALPGAGAGGSFLGILLWLSVMPPLIRLTDHESFAIRVAVTLLSLLPVGLAMGVPFAAGLNDLRRRGPRFIPWAWGMNGLASVLGSILAVILAMRVGFTSVLVAGALCYGIGALAVQRCPKP